MYWLRSEDLKEVKVVTTPINKHSSYRRFVLPKSTSKRLDTREIIGIWVEEKQQSNQPRPPSPKSLRKWWGRSSYVCKRGGVPFRNDGLRGLAHCFQRGRMFPNDGHNPTTNRLRRKSFLGLANYSCHF